MSEFTIMDDHKSWRSLRIVTTPNQLSRPVYVTIGALLLLIAAQAFRAYHRGRRVRQLGNFAPSLPTILPLGLDVAFTASQKMIAHEFLEWTRDILNNAGRTVELDMLNNRVVVTDNPENIKAIMSTQFSHFGHGARMHEAFKSVLGDSIFSTDGDTWLANKTSLRPHVAKIRPTDGEVIEKHVQRMLAKIPSDGSSVEFYDLIDRYQLDVVTEVFLGKSANSLIENQQPFREAVDHLLRLNTHRLLLGPIGLALPDTWLAAKSFRDLNKYLDTFVARAHSLSDDDLASKAQTEYDMMDSMVAQGMSSKAIKDQLTAVLLAAKDPVAILLAWCLHELSHNSKIVDKLTAEIRNIIGESLPTQQTINELPYLKNVIRETIRLYHPVGFNVREARRDTSLPVGGGPEGKEAVGILAGEMVAYSIIGLHRREDIVGADADEFRPERWETWTPETWQYIPFNHGPRICLGRNFGQFQLAYTLVRLFQEFDRVQVTDISAQRQKIKIEMNTKMTEPVHCVFYRKGK